MMAVAIADVLKRITKEEFQASILSVATTLGLPVTSWQEGGVARTLIAIFAQKAADIHAVFVLIARGGLLDFALPTSDDDAATAAVLSGWIDLHAKSVYGITRASATFAAGTLRLTNATNAAIPLVGDQHYAHATSGKTYTYVPPPGTTVPALGTLDVPITADESGSASNAAAATITVTVTPIVGLTASNPTALTGSDAEADVALVARARLVPSSLSPNGPTDAYNYAALSAKKTDGTTAGVTKTKTVGDSTNGTVTVYLATGTGGVTGTVGDKTTALGAADAAIQADVVPITVTATVASATPHGIQVVATVHVRQSAGVDSAALRTAILAKLAAYFAALPIGGTDLDGSGAGAGKVFVNALESVIFATNPGIMQASVTTPSADVTLAANAVATLTSVAGDFTIVQVSS